MRIILVCLVVLFLVWLWSRRGDDAHCPYSQAIEHFVDDEQPENEKKETNLQSLVSFGEIRDAFILQETPSEEKIQSIDERYDAAKRNTPENKLSRGVYTSTEKRRLLEKLIQRPSKSNNVRPKLWRHEFSDRLRGDIVPTHQNNWEINKNKLKAEDSPQGVFTTLQSGIWSADSGGTPMKDDKDMMYIE